MAEAALVESGSHHSDEARRAAVIEYAVCGNMARVSDRLGIPQTTLAEWKNHSEWWPKLFAEVTDQVQDEILANNLQTVVKAQDALLDRVENGDITTQKWKNDEGEWETVEVRTPVKARDLVMISAISQDKARVQLGKPTRISDTTNAMADLAETFRELAKQNREKDVVSEQ